MPMSCAFRPTCWAENSLTAWLKFGWKPSLRQAGMHAGSRRSHGSKKRRGVLKVMSRSLFLRRGTMRKSGAVLLTLGLGVGALAVSRASEPARYAELIRKGDKASGSRQQVRYDQ